MDCEVPVIVQISLSVLFWISIERDLSTSCACHVFEAACLSWMSFVDTCLLWTSANRACLSSLWYPGILRNGALGSRDHLPAATPDPPPSLSSSSLRFLFSSQPYDYFFRSISCSSSSWSCFYYSTLSFCQNF